jgi:hypothetical protein
MYRRLNPGGQPGVQQLTMRILCTTLLVLAISGGATQFSYAGPGFERQLQSDTKQAEVFIRQLKEIQELTKVYQRKLVNQNCCAARTEFYHQNGHCFDPVSSAISRPSCLVTP